MAVLTHGGFALLHLQNELESYRGDPAKDTDPKAGAACGGVLGEKCLKDNSLSSEQLCAMCPSPKIMILDEEPA